MQVPIDGVATKAFTIPTDGPEADGTLSWESTTIVLAFISAGGKVGMGYTYSDVAAEGVIQRILSNVLLDKNALDIPQCSTLMRRAVRNIGLQGIASNAISAADTALWDIKAKLLSLPLTVPETWSQKLRRISRIRE